MMHPAKLGEAELAQECQISFRRASGPGGQNRNKVETGVIVTHIPTGLSGQATERRTQGENRQIAVQRLRLVLAVKIRTPASLAGQETVVKYIEGGKLAVSHRNQDWPAVLAELLDMIAEKRWQIGPVADQLHTTSTQILKAIAREPRAWCYLNENRLAHGLSALKA